MRCLIPALLLASSLSYAEPRLIVIGDSLSSTDESWPVHMDNYHVNLLAQGGRLIREYALPRDLRKTADTDEVVYFLGTGDIINGAKIQNTFRYLVDHITKLRSLGFKVTLVVPPKFEIPQFNDINTLHRQVFRAMLGVNVCDIQWVWNSSMTYDKVHPTPQLSEIIADTIQQCLI